MKDTQDGRRVSCQYKGTLTELILVSYNVGWKDNGLSYMCDLLEELDCTYKSQWVLL